MSNISSIFIAANDTETERICGCCGKKKPVAEFYRDGKHSDGRIRYRRDCRECYKQARIEEKVRIH